MTGADNTKNQAIILSETFAPGSPGPLLLNVEMLLKELENGVPTTSKYFALPVRCLSDLNECLASPLPHQLKRPQLKSFPTLAGLFLLLRASGLAIGETRPKRVVTIDPAMRKQWDSLNATEKTLSLMDAWWNTANWTILGERDRFGEQLQSDSRDLFRWIAKSFSSRSGDNLELFYRYEMRVAAALMEQFGWMKMTYANKADKGKVAEIRSVKATDFGKAMFEILEDTDRPDSIFEDRLQPKFPNCNHRLLPAVRSFRNGRYKLKLGWGRVWRRLETPATTTLERVTASLLNAFDFMEDHLYELTYRDRSGRLVAVVDPRIGEGEYFADEVQLGNLPLSEGDALELLFDFGDQWEFTITIENVDEADTENFEPKITGSHGEAPSQHDYGDDEDDW